MILATKGLILSVYRTGTRMIGIALALYIVLFLVVMGLGQVKDVQNYPAVNVLITAEKLIEEPVASVIRRNIPHTFEGHDLAPWMFIFSIFVLWVLVEVKKSRLLYYAEVLEHEKKTAIRNKALAAERKERLKAQKEAIARLEREANARAERAAKEKAQQEAAALAQQKAYEEAQRLAEEQRRAKEASRPYQEAIQASPTPMQPAAQSSSPVIPSAHNQVQAGGANKPQSREELLELMAQAKKQLELQKKKLSFLAIDVVDSTGMKIGEDPSICSRDFNHYRKLVEKAISDNKGLKAAWTPDGVMICFPSVEAAVGAAKQVIKDLDHFNAHVKAMQRDFKVRCGINAGQVLFDDTIPMEEMSDRSIDIAGHMQKYAGANSIFIGKSVIEEMRTAADFTPASREVDGVEVYQWSYNAN